MPVPGDLFEELKLRLRARQEIERLAREGLEHQAAGRIDEARRCLEEAEEIQAQVRELRGGKTGSNQ